MNNVYLAGNGDAGRNGGTVLTKKLAGRNEYLESSGPGLLEQLAASSEIKVAGLSDRGIIHHENQDALALATVDIIVSPVDVPPIYIAVVCDGVSSSASSASASAIAAKTVADRVKRTFTRFPDACPRKALREAIGAANRAVYAIERDAEHEGGPPATTVAAVVVHDRKATIAWIGDSRVYWVSETDAGVLTRDDTWVNYMVDEGRMTEEEALKSPDRHALVRSLGGEEEAHEAIPSFTTFDLLPGMRLVACSDGFWNYAPTPQNVARLVRHTPSDDPMGTAKHLVNFALAHGGHDNITVAVLAP
jgi:serine/threonine protein phosphatase PrpC